MPPKNMPPKRDFDAMQAALDKAMSSKKPSFGFSGFSASGLSSSGVSGGSSSGVDWFRFRPQPLYRITLPTALFTPRE